MGIKIISSKSDASSPLELFKEMIGGLKSGRHLGLRLAVRDIKTQYGKLKLGFLWNFSEPITYSILFAILRKGSTLQMGEFEVPYSAHVLSGMLYYQIFCQALVRSLASLNEAKQLVTQVKVPPESLILSVATKSLFDASFYLLVLLVTIELTMGLSITSAVHLIAVTPFVILLASAVGLFACPINLIYNEIGRTTSVILRIALFVSPVFYKIPNDSILSIINRFNPLYYIINGVRDIVLTNSFADTEFYILMLVVTPIVYFLAWGIYRLSIPILADKI